MVRAESEQVATAGAGGDAGGVVVSIRVGLRACSLEDPRIGSGLARLRVPEGAGAAVAGGVEGEARTLARHHALLVMRSHLQTHWAHHVQVAHAPRVAALPCISVNARQQSLELILLGYVLNPIFIHLKTRFNIL